MKKFKYLVKNVLSLLLVTTLVINDASADRLERVVSVDQRRLESALIEAEESIRLCKNHMNKNKIKVQDGLEFINHINRAEKKLRYFSKSRRHIAEIGNQVRSCNSLILAQRLYEIASDPKNPNSCSDLSAEAEKLALVMNPELKKKGLKAINFGDDSFLLDESSKTRLSDCTTLLELKIREAKDFCDPISSKKEELVDRKQKHSGSTSPSRDQNSPESHKPSEGSNPK